LPRASCQAVEAYAERIAALVESDATVELVGRHPGLVGRFQDDVVILRTLPRLSEKLRGRVSGVGSQGDHRRTPDTGHLTPLTLDHRQVLKRAAAAIETPLAAYAFAPHYVWRDLFTYAWAAIAGHFCLFAQYTDGWFMPLAPLPLQGRRGARGEGREERDERERRDVRGRREGGEVEADFGHALSEAFALMRSRNKGSAVSRVENIPEEMAEQCRGLGYRVRPKDPDYLYRAADLAALTGDRYKSQRAACNRFERTSRYQVEAYTQDHREGCLALLERWAEQKRRQGVDTIAEHLLRDAAPAHREALAHPEALGLTGTVVRVDGVIRAYSFEFTRSPTISCVLLEVADREVPGLAEFIFRETSRQAVRRGVENINTMDDSGLPSLAQSKRAYHPIRLVGSYVATEA
jgi:hypothetical protein